MLHSQAHWLVAQKANTRPKPAKELAYPNARQTVTMKQIERKMDEIKNTSPNKRYKTLGFKWLFERSAPHQVRCNWTGK